MVMVIEHSSFFENMIDIDSWLNEGFSDIYKDSTSFVLEEEESHKESFLKKIERIMKEWVNKVGTAIKRFATEMSVKITKIRSSAILKKKDDTWGNTIPKEKEFSSFDYKGAMSKIKEMEFVPFRVITLETGKDTVSIGHSGFDKVKKWCGEEKYVVSVKEIKEYALGEKEKTINHSYISFDECIKEIESFDKYITDIKKEETDARKLVEDGIKEAKKVMLNMKESPQLRPQQVIAANNALLTAKISITVGYINQLLKIVHIYQTSKAKDYTPKTPIGIGVRESFFSENVTIRKETVNDSEPTTNLKYNGVSVKIWRAKNESIDDSKFINRMQELDQDFTIFKKQYTNLENELFRDLFDNESHDETISSPDKLKSLIRLKNIRYVGLHTFECSYMQSSKFSHGHTLFVECSIKNKTLKFNHSSLEG